VRALFIHHRATSSFQPVCDPSEFKPTMRKSASRAASDKKRYDRVQYIETSVGERNCLLIIPAVYLENNFLRKKIL
jgi:hypothetical protein